MRINASPLPWLTMLCCTLEANLIYWNVWRSPQHPVFMPMMLQLMLWIWQLLCIMVRPTRAVTFSDYIPMHLEPHPKSLLGPNVQRLDAFWDTYPEWNLKMQAHLWRGNGPRTQPGPEGRTPIPKRDWQKYLSNSHNKELFAYGSRQLTNSDIDGFLIVTITPSGVLTNKQNECDLAGLFPVTIPRRTRDSCCIWYILWARVTPMLMSELRTVIL